MDMETRETSQDWLTVSILWKPGRVWWMHSFQVNHFSNWSRSCKVITRTGSLDFWESAGNGFYTIRICLYCVHGARLPFGAGPCWEPWVKPRIGWSLGPQRLHWPKFSHSPQSSHSFQANSQQIDWRRPLGDPLRFVGLHSIRPSRNITWNWWRATSQKESQIRVIVCSARGLLYIKHAFAVLLQM